jgi:predicted acyl esterase
MFGRSVALVSHSKWLVAALAVIGALLVAPAAEAVTPEKVFVEGAEGVECKVLPSNGDIRECNGPTHTWDGTKIDVNVFLPPEADGPGPYPTIGDFHGWGESKRGLNTKVMEVVVEEGQTFVATSELSDPRIQGWAEKGYAIFSMTDRGWGESCGRFDPDLGEEECDDGWNHLMDDRYEVRDAQYLLSVLADEGIVQPKKIGVTGASYGGGISIALGALRNREMLTGGELVPWVSPGGTEMEIAAAVPQWAWSDIASALAPNGRNLDYVTDSPYRGPTGKLPIGVMKFSYTEGLYKTGHAIGTYSPNPLDTFDNIPIWRERLRGGEPYTDGLVNGMIKELTTYHSAFGIDSSVAPAPMLLQNGWNDDLFPVDEALRFYQRTRAQYAGDPISLFFADYGHSRSQNKAADIAVFNQRLEAWFAHYLKGEGAAPSSSVEALTTDCANSTESEGPYTAADWAGLQPGEIRFRSAAAQTIVHGTPAEEQVPTTSSGAYDPIVGAKNPCVALPSAAVANPHAVDYSLAPAPGGGYILMGSPTIIANIVSPSPNSEIAARLLDVSPEGTESLLARGLYRPVGGNQEIVFQLHPQAYHVSAGHVVKLELLPSDFPYGRFSNLQTNVTVNSLELRLPVMEQPGSLGGLVQTPAPKVVPPGYTLAAEFEQKAPPNPPAPVTPAPKPVTPAKVGFAGIAGKLTANRKAVIVPVRCSSDGACTGSLSFSMKKSRKKVSTIIARGNYSLTASTATNVKVPLTKAGRKLIKKEMAAKKKKLAGVLQLQDVGRANTLTLNRAAKLPRGK